jgi:hypothetical protein
MRTTYLVVESAGAEHGRRIDLGGYRMTVGRLPACDVQLDDLQVSRTHAALWRRDSVDYVEDLGSSGGTFVNGERIDGARGLHAGDAVAFAGLRLRYGGDHGSGSARSVDPAPRVVRYDIGEQEAGAINNVGRDQYYSQHIVQQRESFFREVAAAKTKARWLIWTGLVVFLVGLAIAAVGGFNYAKLFADLGSYGPDSAPEFDFSGLLTALLGVLVNTVGLIVIIIGVVLHIVATSRRQRGERELPPPPYRGK